MLLFFFNRDGSAERVRRYVSNGRSFFDDVEQITDAFDHTVGEVVAFHTGHGIMRNYRVAAMDDTAALLVCE